LFNIQAVNGRQFSTAAALQQTRSKIVYLERGDILDRDGIRFTGRNTHWKAILQPATLLNNPTGLKIIADILNMKDEELNADLSKSILPYLADVSESQAKVIADSALEGISVINMRNRYSPETLAAHILGYVNERGDEGLSGIEKYYQDTLKRGGGVYAGIMADAGDGFMSSFGYRIWDSTGSEKLNVRLTLDYHIQSIVEDVMDNMAENSAVVVLDILTGEVLAMASRPDFDPSNINPSLNDENQAMFNRALGTYTPGSIFKIITASAALEKDITPDLTYECKGYVDLGGIRMKCSSYDAGGHGSINMAQAFAKSCNSYFINLGLKIGEYDILEMASRFGLGSKTGLYS
jgi:cell division protein FtsI/penicillin-binding protein 2